jgi:hypothetical protein
MALCQAKTKEKTLFWCAELDLTDRTHLRVQYTKTSQNEHPVLPASAFKSNTGLNFWLLLQNPNY